MLEETGWPIKDELFQHQGDLLGSGEKPKYMYGMERNEFEKYVRKAKRNGIPSKVFRQRLYKGHRPEVASTMEYKPIKGRK